MTIEQANKLKIGDKVICNNSFNNLPQKGWIGKVVVPANGIHSLGIEWEKSFKSGHSCDEKGKKDSCRFYWRPSSCEDDSISILSIYNNNQLEFEF